jgi:hypothetical protein
VVAGADGELDGPVEAEVELAAALVRGGVFEGEVGVAAALLDGAGSFTAAVWSGPHAVSEAATPTASKAADPPPRRDRPVRRPARALTSRVFPRASFFIAPALPPG